MKAILGLGYTGLGLRLGLALSQPSCKIQSFSTSLAISVIYT